MLRKGTNKIAIPPALAATLLLTFALSGSSADAMQGKVTVRPIDDWIAAQGTFAGELIFINWRNSEGTLFNRVDYAGLLNRRAERISGGEISFGTEMSGMVTERPLADGRTEVHVVLHTKDALTFVRDRTQAGAPDIFGSRLGSFFFGGVLFGGVNPSLADSFLDLTYITPNAPGAPLADFLRLAFFPQEEEETIQVLFAARSNGELRAAFGVPDGTPGHLTVVQKGIFQHPVFDFDDPFGFVAGLNLVEEINLEVVGH